MPQQYSQDILIMLTPALTNGPVVPRSCSGSVGGLLCGVQGHCVRIYTD